jgi:hypothetical protein
MNPWLILLDIVGWLLIGGIALIAAVVVIGIAIGVTQAVRRGKSKTTTTKLIGK